MTYVDEFFSQAPSALLALAKLVIPLLILTFVISIGGGYLLDRYEKRRAADDTPIPPGTAEWLLTLLAPRQSLDGIVGDLQERFHRNVKSRGVRRAKWLYWAETLRSIAPLLWSAAQKIGVVAVVAAAARRLLG